MSEEVKDSPAYRLRQIIDWLGEDKGSFGDWIGAGSSRLSGWTKGTYPPPIEFALKIKAEHKISLDWLYTGDGSGQARALTKELEAIVPVPLRLKPRGRKQVDAAESRPAKRKSRAA